MNIYGAIPRQGKYVVAKQYSSVLFNTDMAEWHILGDVRAFSTWNEANKVALDISRGIYPDLAPSGRYVNMR